jgi:hypothetical protein
MRGKPWLTHSSALLHFSWATRLSSEKNMKTFHSNAQIFHIHSQHFWTQATTCSYFGPENNLSLYFLWDDDVHKKDWIRREQREKEKESDESVAMHCYFQLKINYSRNPVEKKGNFSCKLHSHIHTKIKIVNFQPSCIKCVCVEGQKTDVICVSCSLSGRVCENCFWHCLIMTIPESVCKFFSQLCKSYGQEDWFFT